MSMRTPLQALPVSCFSGGWNPPIPALHDKPVGLPFVGAPAALNCEKSSHVLLSEENKKSLNKTGTIVHRFR